MHERFQFAQPFWRVDEQEVLRATARANQWKRSYIEALSSENAKKPSDAWLRINAMNWFQFASWDQCSCCSNWFHRTLSQAELRQPERAQGKMGKRCDQCKSHGIAEREFLRPELVPSCLRQLDLAIEMALAPIVVHQGSPRKHPSGFFRKDRITSLSWKKESVATSIRRLDAVQQPLAREAYRWLLGNNSVYLAYMKCHTLKLQADHQERDLWLPPSAMLEPYLECACFPLRYWRKELCESHIYGGDWSDPFMRQATRNTQYLSAKRQFVDKLCSLNVAFHGYSLLQFQFDRYVLRTMVHTGAVADAGNFDRSLMLNEKHWTQGYWKRHHHLLLDVTASHGHPDVFVTIAPYEWSCPYPYWVQKTMDAMGKGATNLPGPEVLATAHLLHQICAGLLCGKVGKKPWQRNLLSDKRQHGSSGVRTYFARFEFQTVATNINMAKVVVRCTFTC